MTETPAKQETLGEQLRNHIGSTSQAFVKCVRQEVANSATLRDTLLPKANLRAATITGKDVPEIGGCFDTLQATYGKPFRNMFFGELIAVDRAANPDLETVANENGFRKIVCDVRNDGGQLHFEW